METFLWFGWWEEVDRKWLWVGRIAVEGMEEDQPAFISEGGRGIRPRNRYIRSNQIRTITFPPPFRHPRDLNFSLALIFSPSFLISNNSQ